MKKFIITCTLIASVATVSFGQGVQTTAARPQSTAQNAAMRQAPTPATIAERRAKTAQRQYGLNDQQYASIYQLESNYATQEANMKANGGKPSDGQVMQNNMGRDQGYKAVLTADQYTKYQAMQARMSSTAAPATK